MDKVGAFIKKLDYVTIFKEILNFKGDLNCITGSKVTAILLDGWILVIGEASAVKGLHLQPAQHACFVHDDHVWKVWITFYLKVS